MADVIVDRIIVELDAKVDRYRARTKKAKDEHKQAMEEIGSTAEKSEKKIDNANKGKSRTTKKAADDAKKAATETATANDKAAKSEEKVAAAAEARAKRVRKARQDEAKAPAAAPSAGPSAPPRPPRTPTNPAPTAGPSPASGAGLGDHTKINAALLRQTQIENELAIARERGNRKVAVALQDQVNALRLIERLERAGVPHTEARARAERQLAAIQAARGAREREFARNIDNVKQTLFGMAGAFAAYFGAREIIALTDSYTRFQNALRVAGVEGGNLEIVQTALVGTARKYGVELEALGQLYGRIAQASSELGLSQEKMLQMTNAVAAAIKVQGGTADAAKGALLQFGQALQAGTVRAEEYNSINEGAFPILQAAARGSDRFAGSVAKLRAAVIDGTVSSEEFAQAILRGSDWLEKRASKSALTTAASLTILRDSLMVYIGEADKASGASAALGNGIRMIADNLDSLVPAIVVLGTAIGVGYTANLVRATVVSAQAAAAAGTAATSFQAAGKSLLGAFGGGIGLAITAVTVALVSFVTESANYNRIMAETENVTEDTRDAIAALGLGTDAAASGINNVGNNASTARVKIERFAGAVGDAADKLYQLAQAQRESDLASLRSQQQKLTSQADDLRRRTGAGAVAAMSEQNYLGGNLANIRNLILYGGRNLASGGRSDREANSRIEELQKAAREVANTIKNLPTVAQYGERTELRRQAGVDPVNRVAVNNRQSEIKGLEAQKARASGAALDVINDEIDERKREIKYLEQGVSESAAKAAAAREVKNEVKATKNTAKAERLAVRDAERARKDGVADEDSFNSTLKKLNNDLLSAKADATNSEVMRADLTRQQIADDAARAIRDIELSGPKGSQRFNQAEVERLSAIIRDTAAVKTQTVTDEAAARAKQQALEITLASLQLEQEVEGNIGRLATTADARKASELRLLDLQMQEERSRLEAVQASQTATEAEKEIARRRLAQLPTMEAQRKGEINKSYQGPLGDLRDELNNSAGNMGDALESVEANGIRSLIDGLSNAKLNVQDLGATFKSVAGSIIQDLKRILIQKAITFALDTFLPGLGSLSSLAGGRANGGNVRGGQVYPVGERGVELFRAPVSGHITSNNQLAANPNGSRSMGAPIISVAVDARGNVSAAEVEAAATRAVFAAAPMLVGAAQQRTMNNLGRVSLPGGVGV